MSSSDVTQHQNVFADSQIAHFYRWLSSSESMLYDPALKRSLHAMMKKLFIQLIAEFKRLGAQIVYANFDRLIVCTKKRELVDALGYIEYVTNSISAKPLFHMIDVTFTRGWSYLVWMDPANHGGITDKPALEADVEQAKTQSEAADENTLTKSEAAEQNMLPESEAADDKVQTESEAADDKVQTESEAVEEQTTVDEPDSETEPLDKSDDDTDRVGDQDEDNQSEATAADDANEEEENMVEVADMDVEMNWNLAKFLPEAGSCQDNFSLIVAGYIMAVYKHQKQTCGDAVEGDTPVARKSNSQTQEDLKSSPPVVEFSQKLIQDDLCQHMFLLTQRIERKLSASFGGSRELSGQFPSLPGSHLDLKNPALEFVKSVCEVLSLDSNVSNQVTKMKRDLLKLIGVAEFSDEAVFKDPCLSHILPEVICKTCNCIRDLDLCKDPSINMADNTAALWCCSSCGAEYDRDDIEHVLIESLQRKCMADTLQDVKCGKCNGIQDGNMSDSCKCAGNFTTVLDGGDLAQTLRTFTSIAQHYDMQLLIESIEWLLSIGNSNNGNQ